ncbi:MAG: GDP-mannose 4,6 dehydratase [Halioglobus sp.]|nr:GDP-mannose 4,6 dehydratase [Halioglobus sp.]|tara:strand:- start:771 stop:1628 length:858 start_codon:yes stop_codon:yes gene_type:complete
MAGTLLLTGAEGFTGGHLARAARQQGYSVHALAADITDARAVEQELATQHFDYVVHLAAISAVTHADELALYQVNLFGTLNLLQGLLAMDPPPRKVIIASSANIYGNSAASPLAEDTPPAPVNHYAMSKLAMEHMSATFADYLPLVTTRPFNYTGVGHDERFVVPKLVRHFREKQPAVELGNLEVEREFNDVRGVCLNYLELLQHGSPGEAYNLCSGVTYSLREVVDILSGITGHTLELRVNPAFIRPNEVHRLCGDPGKLRECIGDVPHPHLRDTLSWMLDSRD